MLFIFFATIFASYNPPMQPIHGQQFQQAPMACEQILDPNFCKGPSMEPGYICSWQEMECESINLAEFHGEAEAPEAGERAEAAESQCKVLSANQVACQAKPGCHYEDFECKMGDNFAGGHPGMAGSAGSHPGMTGGTGSHPGMTGASVSPHTGLPTGLSPQLVPGAYPQGAGTAYPPQTQGAGAAYPPQTQGAGAAYPPQTQGAGGAYPPQTQGALPASGGAFGFPTTGHGGSAVVLPTAHGMNNPTNANGIPSGIAPPQGSGAAVQPASTNPTHQTLPSTSQAPSTSGAPQFCRSLPHIQCFGPSMTPGEVCTWDAEDMECTSANANDMEAICKQFASDPFKCDQHENCFWDELDFECSEVEYGTFPVAPHGKPNAGGKPSGMNPGGFAATCSNYRDVTSCAGQAHCFWDGVAGRATGVCINVVQAQNVCRVLNTPQHCSTNALCAWRGTACQSVAGILRAVHNPKTESEPQYIPSTLVCGVAASVLGLLLGLFLSWATSKCTREQTSNNEDYRDISMDINSQRLV